MPIEWTQEAINAAYDAYDKHIDFLNPMRHALDAAVKAQGMKDELDAFLHGMIAGQREGWNDAIEAAAKECRCIYESAAFYEDEALPVAEAAIRSLAKSGE